MATFLLDTNIIIDVLRNKPGRLEFLADLVRAGDILACCPINVTEIYAGLRPNDERQTERFLASLEYLPITSSAARRAGLLKRDFAKKGVTLSTTDVTIAAVTIEHQIALITDNIRDFPMQGLHIVTTPWAY